MAATGEVAAPPKVAVVQMCSTADRDANWRACESMVEAAVREGAMLVCFPECFHFMAGKAGESVGIAERLDGPAMARYRSLARRAGVWLSLGGFQERTEEEEEAGKLYNTHVVLDAAGAIAASYRKAHLFDVATERVTLRESDFTQPGNALVACDSPVGRLGLSTCYDIRFPEVYSALAGAGAQVMLVPAAFTVPTGTAHWEVLLRARAIETQSYVLAAAQVGEHNERRVSFGHSMIVDPWGTVVARAATGAGAHMAGPQLICATLDSRYTAAVRSQLPVATHRRPELYLRPVEVARTTVEAQ